MTETVQSVGRGLRMVSAFYGILMIICGMVALAAPVVATLATTVVVGIALIAGGAVGLFASFQERSGNGRWLNVLWSLLAIGLGIWMVAQPGVGAVSLTLLLGAVLAARGVTGLILAFDSSFGSSRMVLFNLMEMVGGTIGIFVGVDFLITGITILLASMMGPRATT